MVQVSVATASLAALLALVAGIGRTSLALARAGDLPRGPAAVHGTYELSHHLRPGEVALLGWRGDALVAVAHLLFTEDDDAVETFVAAIAVSAEVRGEGGVLADATMAEVWNLTCGRAIDRGASSVFLTGKISTRNHPAQRMAERCGQEPVGLPAGELQLWIRRGQIS